MVEHFKNYINGEWVGSASSETFENINPSDIEEVLGIFPRSGKEDVDKAVQAAKDALENWKSITPPERGCIISEAARILASRKKELAEIISLENGKTDGRLGRNFLRGREGGNINALLSGCGYNMRKLLKVLLLCLFFYRQISLLASQKV